MRRWRRWADARQGGRRGADRHGADRYCAARRWADDSGSASLEFITIGMIMLVPLVYLVLAVAATQGGALAVEGAARHAARVYVQAPDDRAARASAERAVEFALADHGVTSRPELAISCSPRPSDCLQRRSLVTVTVAVRVPLPLVPPVLVGDFPLSVPLTATATDEVSRFWGAP